ncbi:MAG: phosphoribosylamine--glycine ligase [Brevinematales bacterium]|jgi:phosphoribosylamine--glycine ligase
MNIAVIGGGGRESAIAWALSKSKKCKNLYILPGNGGTTKYGRNIPADITSPFNDIKEFIEIAMIDLVVVGPEQPLTEGIVDVLEKSGAKIFGPGKRASRLEGSKVWLKQFLEKYNIPTAKFKVFEEPGEALDFVKSSGKCFVVKTDGLAAGKGALVCASMEETHTAVKRIMIDREFGPAGEKIVLEEFLEGIEVSVFIVTDGQDYKWLASAQDHKRIHDDDLGPNTGGMGAYAPVPFLDDITRGIIEKNIIKPTIAGMQKEGCPYTGFLYLGLMLTKDGPYVIEYNIRLGDPEAQVVLPLLKTDLLEIITASMNGGLGKLKVQMEDGYCAGVVLASQGYPGSYSKGIEIKGDIDDEPGVYVFHAGTKAAADGRILTDGGRVMCVSALGADLREAIMKAYDKATRIDYKGITFRKDIGRKGLKYFEEQ